MTRLAQEIWHAITFNVPYNTAVVLRGVTLLGAACGIVGTFLLLRKRSLVADAISHAALPGVCLGFLTAIWLGMDGRPMWMLLSGAAIAGLAGFAAIHWLTSLPRIKEDAAIGAVLSTFFALGVMLLGIIQNLPVSHKAGLNAFIFGQAATLTASDARAILVIAAAILITAIITFKEMRLLCFDAGYAHALGFGQLALDALLISMVLMLTVIGMHAVGVLLMIALLIIPAVSARFWTDRFINMTIIAACIGAIGAFAGAAASSILANLPTGPAIVMACGVIFALSMTLGPSRGIALELLRRWRLNRRVARQHLLRAMYECEELALEKHQPITINALLTRRRWVLRQLHRTLKRLIRQGDIIAVDNGYRLSKTGSIAAQRIVRSHRLWEHYLTTHADIAPSHVDRAADDIEHVLGEKLVSQLEATLASQPLPPSAHAETVPASPHRLTPKPRSS